MTKLLCTLLLVISSMFAQAQGFLRAEGGRIVDERGNNVLLRGMGLGGWMLQEPYMMQLSGAAANQGVIRSRIDSLIGTERTAAFYNAWLANHCTKADIDSLAAWGFNSVRLPMHYNLYTLPVEKEPVAGQHTWIEKGFALTDSLLGWCKANRLYLILDLHAAPGGQGKDAAISDYDATRPSLWESEANKQKTIALWRKLAERYKDEPWIGGYDLINETNWGFQQVEGNFNGCAETDNGPLRKLLVDITAAIRTVDTRHIIYIEANCWANNYRGVLPPWDNNLVLSFHKYWNHNTQATLQQFIDHRQRYNIPIWMGEGGENSNTWFRDAISIMEANNIGWAWWPLKKLGHNNPLQVPVPDGYRRLTDYFRGRAPRPSADSAFSALMQLAENSHIRNNIYQEDVTDALFRQVRTNATLPFLRHRLADTMTVFAVDYDMGRNGYAFYDRDSGNYWVSTGERTAGNQGNRYRNDAVDIEANNDTRSNGYSVGWIETGEWLQYTIEVPRSGRYDIELRTAGPKQAGKVRLDLDGRALAPIAILPVTGANDHWRSTTLRSLALPAGTHTLRLYALEGGFNLNYLRFIPTGK